MPAISSSWTKSVPVCCIFVLSWCLRQAQGQQTFQVVENSTTGFEVGRINNGSDGGSSYMFFVNDDDCNTYFDISSDSGVISVKNQTLLDREAMLDHLTNNNLQCFVGYNSGGSQKRLPINIKILDLNDETPSFSGLSQPYQLNLTENINAGSLILTLQPVDNDNGVNGTTMFSITGGNENYFEIRVPEMETENSTTVRDLFIVRELDYDEVPGGVVNLTVTITDAGEPPLVFVQTILIAVINLQDEIPTFETTSYFFNVSEDHPVDSNTPFSYVLAGTAQGGKDIEYEMSKTDSTDIVGVDNRTGGLYLRSRVDYENTAMRMITFTVIARNVNTRGDRQATVNVVVLDVANEPLYFKCENSYISPSSCPTELNGTEFSIEENQQIFRLLQLREVTRNSMFTVNFSTFPEDAPLVYTKPPPPIPDIIISLASGKTLDRENFPVITVILTTRMKATPFLQTITIFHIRVLDRNDNKPEFVSKAYEGVVFEGNPIGRKVLQVEAMDADNGENGTVSYSITSVDKEEAESWFEIAPDTGIISVSSPDADCGEVDGSVTLNVTATDNGTDPFSSSVPVTIRTVLSTAFSLNSYQQYSSQGINLLTSASQDIYLEFLPKHDGLLLFQQDPSGDAFSISYQGGVVVVRFGEDSKNATASETSKDVWMAIHVQKMQQQISSLEVGSTASNSLLLQNLTVLSCIGGGETTPIQDDHLSLYIGGVNEFDVVGNTSLPTTSFTGGIRNVVVGGVQLDTSCPTEQVNTMQGVVYSSQRCNEMSCTSNRSIGCVDLTIKPYCQCLGGFSAQACKISDNKEEEETSYAPIRFTGNSGVKLNLGYAFFIDLQERQRPETEDVSTGVNGRRRKRRNADNSGDVEQVVELEFRAVNLEDSVLLNSQTDSSNHIIEILESSNGSSYLKYSILSLDHATSVNLTLSTPLQKETLYHIRAILRKKEIILQVSGGSGSTNIVASWESGEISEVPIFAEQPATSIAIGSSLQPQDSKYFTGCITRFAINDIEVPLNGLLTASMDEGGFEVNMTGEVLHDCDLCDLHVCPDRRHCVPGMLGESSCSCNEPYIERKGSCVIVLAGTDELNPRLDNNTIYVIAGCALGGILFLGIFVISIIVMCRKRQEKKKAGRYSVNTSSIARSSRSRNNNDYSPSILKKKTSFTSSMNGNCMTESNEQRSSVSTFQEHAEDADPETNSPLHHNARSRRKSCTSVESGIKLDDREMGGISVRGIPTMEDSGHEVNSTDSNRTSESDEIASSCCNDQLNSRSPVSLARGNSADHRMPRTPLTPKEKKVMIPLRPPSTNLSQSKYDEEEAIETESFHTRVSSSSGMGNSMQNQGRGSDTDSSKTSDSSRWYLLSGLDKERDKIHLQTLRPYYPPSHLGEAMQGGTHAYPSEIPLYHSPPTFSEHIDRSYARGRSKSMHSGKSPLSPLQSSIETNHTTTTAPRSYENYPGHFNVSGEMRGNGIMYKGGDMHYNAHQFHDRDLDATRAANDRDYTPSSLFSRQYSDPKIPRNGNYCIPRKHDEPWPVHNHQISDPQQSSQQTQDSTLSARGAHAPIHMNLYPSNSTTTAASSIRHPPVRGNRQFYTLGHTRHVNFAPTNQQTARSFSNGDAAATNEQYQTLNSLSKIDPISNWDAQDRMKIAVDHMDPCHLLSGPCIPFEYVSTDPSVVESQTTVDESIMGGSHQMFESQGGGEGISHLLDPLVSMVRLREDEIDSILTDSEVGHQQVMNHFPSADCSSQYTATIVAGSTSTSGESTPKLQNVFVMPSSQQSFDV